MTAFLFMISVALWTLPGGELAAAHALTRDALYHVRYVQDLEQEMFQIVCIGFMGVSRVFFV